MKNHIPKLKALHAAIEATLFTIHPKFDYSRLTNAIGLAARIVADYPGETEGWLYIGEFGHCRMDSLLVGAYWHFSQWHDGQYSPAYATLCSLGSVFDPGMTQGPKPQSSELDVFKALDAMARRANRMPVYSFREISITV